MVICQFSFPDEEINWRNACVERERSHRVWTNPEEYMEHFTYNDALFAAVDVVHLMQVCTTAHTEWLTEKPSTCRLCMNAYYMHHSL